MSKIKHSKFKNPILLFELLVKQITSDLMEGKESNAIGILKKYFTKTELGKEYKLYEIVFKNKNITEDRANMVLNTVIESYKKVNKTSLKKEKYNLIKEIKESYNLDEFFKTSIPNYKQYASLYIILESYSDNNFTNPDVIINSKINILEHLTKSNIDQKGIKSQLLEELSSLDKDTRILTQHILLDNFNTKYKNLPQEHKFILKEFINSVDNKPKLKNLYNNKIKEIKIHLNEFIDSTEDKILKIKLTEVSKYLNELGKNDKIKDEHLIDLMQYFSLLKELKNGKI